MPELDPLRESVAALGRFVINDAPMDETLQRVTELAAHAVPATDLTGLSMLVDDKPTTAFFSDAEAADIDAAQYRTGKGPCLDAFRHGEVYIIVSTADDVRWPEFAHTALQHGVRSTMSLPLRVGDRSIGALNFYSHTEAAFGDAEREAGDRFAVQAAIVLANAQAYVDAHDLAQRLAEAMESRAVIEQAKGILIMESGVDADAAFEILVRASQRENRKLRAIAAELVERHSRRDG